jgi:hypothetical protein
VVETQVPCKPWISRVQLAQAPPPGVRQLEEDAPQFVRLTWQNTPKCIGVYTLDL